MCARKGTATLLWALLLLQGVLGAPAVGNDLKILGGHEDSLPCNVCCKGVEMTRQNPTADFSDIKSSMQSYCRSVYSQYSSNCFYIVNNYLVDIYTKARIYPLFSATTICIAESLCPDKSLNLHPPHSQK